MLQVQVLSSLAKLIRNGLGASVGVATVVISLVESLYVRAGYDVVFIDRFAV